MPFQTIPINITGPSYHDRSRPLSSQETRGFYTEVVQSGKEQYVIKSFPGQKILGSTTAGEDRGQHQMLEVGYRVIGKDLYEVLIDGTHIQRGDIPGTDRCIFADDGINMYMVANGIVSRYSSVTTSVTTVTDPDITGALSVAFINNQFLYTFPLLTVVSTVGDGSTATSLNAIGAEANPDDLVRDYVFESTIYRCGTRIIEPWYNPGEGTPPIHRIEGQVINIGLAAIHSINKTKEFIYWLGTDLQIYRARGGQEQAISTAAIAGAIQGYSVVSDAFTEVFTIDNHQIVMMTFPTANKTWCLNEGLEENGWFELSEGITDGRYNAGSIVEVYNKVLIGDRSNGELYTLDFDTYDQNGTTWRRRRVLASINGDILKAKGHRITMSSMEFIMEKGTGLVTGQGDDPKLMIEASYDGGKSWATGTWIRTGRLGETNIRANWDNMKSFYDMIVRITTSDPVSYSLYSATIDVKLAGR